MAGNERITELEPVVSLSGTDLFEVVQTDPITGISTNKKAQIENVSVSVLHNSLPDLQEAGTGVTWGHIDDTNQTIAGKKTFSSQINLEAVAASSILMTDTGKNVVATNVLPNGTLATTQPDGNSSNLVATTEFVMNNSGTGGGYWKRVDAVLSPATVGDDVSVGYGGLLDANITIPIKVGDLENQVFTTSNQTIIGAVNEINYGASTIIPNTLYVNNGFPGTVFNGSITHPYRTIMDAINAIPIPVSGDDADLKTVYKIYVYSGQYDEDILVPYLITPRIIHLIAMGPVYLGLSTGTNFDNPVTSRNFTYPFSKPDPMVSSVTPNFSLLASDQLNNDIDDVGFLKQSGWRISGNVYLGDVTIGGSASLSTPDLVFENVTVDGINFTYIPSTNVDFKANIYFYGCNLKSSRINFPYINSPMCVVSIMCAEKTIFGYRIIANSISRLVDCTVNDGFVINEALPGDNHLTEIVNTYLNPAGYLSIETGATYHTFYIDPQSRLLSVVNPATFSTGITFVDHVLLAGNGVIYGHINDQAQPIEGQKTFSDPTFFPYGIGDNDVQNPINIGDPLNTELLTDNKSFVGAINEVYNAVESITTIPNVIYVDQNYTGPLELGSVLNPYKTISAALYSIPAPLIGSDSDIKTVYKIYVYSGQYNEDISVPSNITPRIIHLVAFGPVYLGLSTGKDFSTPVYKRNVVYKFSGIASNFPNITPTFSLLTSDKLDDVQTSEGFYQNSGWKISGDFLIGDITPTGPEIRMNINLCGVTIAGNFKFSDSSSDDMQANLTLNNCRFEESIGNGDIKCPFENASPFGFVYLLSAENTFFGGNIITYSLGRFSNCQFTDGFKSFGLLESDNGQFSIENSYYPSTVVFELDIRATDNHTYTVDVQTEQLSPVSIDSRSLNVDYVRHLKLTGVDITFGHINDGPQLIYGRKEIVNDMQFDDDIFVSHYGHFTDGLYVPASSMGSPTITPLNRYESPQIPVDAVFEIPADVYWPDTNTRHTQLYFEQIGREIICTVTGFGGPSTIYSCFIQSLGIIPARFRPQDDYYDFIMAYINQEYIVASIKFSITGDIIISRIDTSSPGFQEFGPIADGLPVGVASKCFTWRVTSLN